MIPLLGQDPVDPPVRLRYGAPTIVNYQPVRPAPTSATINATVVPATWSTQQRAPNGVAVRDLVTIASYDELRTAVEGGAYADRLVVDGVTYEVQWTMRQPPFLGQPEHWEADGLKVQTIEVPEPEAP